MKLANNSLWCFQNDHFLLVSTGELCRDIGDFAFFPVTKVRRNRNNHLEVFLGKGVLKICSKFTGEHPCRSAISIKLQRNFSKNTSGWLLLFWFYVSKFQVFFLTHFMPRPLSILSENIRNLFPYYLTPWFPDVFGEYRKKTVV